MSRKVAYCAVLIALAMIFSYVEVLIPVHIGIPGIKLGLANLVVVAGFALLSPLEVFLISFGRIVLTSLLFGTGLSMLYSLAGGLLSYIVMLLLYQGSSRKKKPGRVRRTETVQQREAIRQKKEAQRIKAAQQAETMQQREAIRQEKEAQRIKAAQQAETVQQREAIRQEKEAQRIKAAQQKETMQQREASQNTEASQHTEAALQTEARKGFSLTGVSIAGGAAHNIGQLLVAAAVVENLKIFVYLPVLLAAGTITGMLIGIVASKIVPALKKAG